MDITGIVADLASARSKVVALITAERKVFADPKADVEALQNASKALRVAAKIDGALKSAESRVTKATTKKVKKAKPAKPAEAAKK